MYQFQIPWDKIIKLGKYIFVLLVLCGLGYLAYMTYYYATNQPYKIRVTNVTGTSATVSWYTNRPDKGIVAVKEKNSFIPGLAWLGATFGYDDRDVALAQIMLADEATKDAEQDVDANYEVTLDSEDLSNLKVTKKGKYYVHHVTVNNLSEDKGYYFRVGNGLFWWNVKSKNQTHSDIEAPTLVSLEFKTFNTPEELFAPDPSFGKVVSLARNSDGFLTSNPSTDSIVFVNAYTPGSSKKSSYLSSVTNSDGGWVVDKSNIRNSQGEVDYKTYEQYKSFLYVYTQLENIQPDNFVEMVWGFNDSPAEDLIGGGEEEAQVTGTLLDELKFSLSRFNYLSNLKAIVTQAFAQTSPTSTTSQTSGSTPSSKSAKSVIARRGTVYSVDDSKNVPSAVGGLVESKQDCDEGQVEKDGECVSGKTVALGSSGTGSSSKNSIGAALSADVFNSKNSPSSTASLGSGSVTGGCGEGVVAVVVDGRKICPNSGYNHAQTLQGTDNPSGCSGNYVRSCEVDDGCFCQWGNGAGYSRLEGKSCRPSSCASYINGDYNNGDLRVVLNEDGSVKTIDGKNPLLCGTDTTSKGCTLDESRTARDGTLLCATGTTKVKDGVDENGVTKYKCEENATDGRTPPSRDPQSGGASGGVSGKKCAPNSVNLLGICVYTGDSNQTAGNSANKDCAYEEGLTFNCGQRKGTNCGKQTQNNGCQQGNSCLPVEGYGSAGFCAPDTNVVGFHEEAFQPASGPNNAQELVDSINSVNDFLGTDLPSGGNFNFNCFMELDNNGKVVGRILSSDFTDAKDLEPSDPNKENDFAETDVSKCLEGVETVRVGQSNKSPNSVYAAKNVEVKTDGSVLVIFPESGIYDVQIGDQEFKNIYVDKGNRHFFYTEKNNIKGYQLPADPKKPKNTEDQLLSIEGAVVTLHDEASNQSLKLNDGINIVSFNYLPSRVEGKNMNARQLMRVLNSSKVNVTRITTFEGGKWLGGVAYDEVKNEVVGTDFLISPGKGYLIVSNTDFNATVPGYGIKNSIPVALSKGWNLVGVNGFSKTFTAGGLLDSINELNGIDANNVTWWPTSKGRYETFQKSEGVEYGFDFPILKDIGYFVRVNEFDTDFAKKSILWNPGGDLHGEPGSK